MRRVLYVDRDLRIANLAETLLLETDERPLLGEPREIEIERIELRGVKAEIELADPSHIIVIVRKPSRGRIAVEYVEGERTARIYYSYRG